MNASKSERALYPELIRGVAIILVILVHISAEVLSPQGGGTPPWATIGFDQWNFANLYDSIARPCVPLFIMLSGALLLNKQESAKAFFRKRFSKLLIPLLFWVTAYILWRAFYTCQGLDLDIVIKLILKGSASYHLWYLYMIIGLYLITPLLRKLVTVLSEEDFKYYFTIWAIIYAVIPLVLYLEYIYVGYWYYFGIEMHMSSYIGYFLLGHYLKDKKFTQKTIKWCHWGFWVSILITFIGTWKLSVDTEKLQIIFYQYTSITTMVQSVATYILLMHYGSLWESKLSNFKKGIFRLVGQLSFAVYLSHVMILDLLKDGGLGFKLHGSSFYSAFAIPVTAVVTFATSLLICWGASKVPFLQHAIIEMPSKNLNKARDPERTA